MWHAFELCPNLWHLNNEILFQEPASVLSEREKTISGDTLGVFHVQIFLYLVPEQSNRVAEISRTTQLSSRLYLEPHVTDITRNILQE